MVVPVLMTSCQVSDQPKTGPEAAHATTGLFDRRGNFGFCQDFVADHPRRFGAVACPDGRLR
jgi:hypothetical protein